MAGWMKMPLGMEVDISPGDFCVRWGPRCTLPKHGGTAPSPIFGPFLLLSNGCNTATCIKMPFDMEVGLSPGDFVLDGNPAPLNVRPMFIIVIVNCDCVRTLHKAHSLLVYSSSSFSILCILFLEKFSRTHAVCSN